MVCNAFLVILYLLSEIVFIQCQTLLGDKCKARTDDYFKLESSKTNDRLTKLEVERDSQRVPSQRGEYSIFSYREYIQIVYSDELKAVFF